MCVVKQRVRESTKMCECECKYVSVGVSMCVDVLVMMMARYCYQNILSISDPTPPASVGGGACVRVSV